MKLHGCSRLLIAFGACWVVAQAQSVAFELKSYPDSPIAVVSFAQTTFRADGKRRQFVTVKNVSDRPVAAFVVQQNIVDGQRREIAAMERISVIMRSHETKRLSMSVEDVWNRAQGAAKPNTATGKPVLSIVVVEFIDGPAWNAPLEPAVR